MAFHFLYVADNIYFNLMRLSIISSIKHHTGAIYHVFTMDSPETKQVQISPKNREKLKREITNLDKNAQILYYDVRELYMQKLANSVNKDTKFSPYAALRLLAPYVLNDVNIILYLDSDTIIVDSLNELFTDHKEKNFDFAAVRDIYNTEYTKLKGTGFLSGLILFNLRHQRETSFRFIDNAIRCYNTIKYEMPDQEALSAANPADRFFLNVNYLQYYYVPNDIKVVCVAYRNIVPIAPFLRQAIFPLNAQRILDKTEQIARVVSNYQTNIE